MLILNVGRSIEGGPAQKVSRHISAVGTGTLLTVSPPHVLYTLVDYSRPGKHAPKRCCSTNNQEVPGGGGRRLIRRGAEVIGG